MQTTLSPQAQLVLAALRAHTDGCTSTDNQGHRWHTVYLDNARPSDMSARSFAGYLSALEKAGLYRSFGDDCFGEVLEDQTEVSEDDELDLSGWEVDEDDPDCSKKDAELLARGR